MEIIEIQNKYHTNEDDFNPSQKTQFTLFNIKKPKILNPLPSIPIPKGLSKCDLNEFYQDFFNKYFRWSNVEGMNFESGFEGFCELYCDYCETSFNINKYQICPDFYYWFCNHCKKDMCQWCYEETNEEIAKQHKSIYWHERKEILEQCREKNPTKRSVFNQHMLICDLCQKDSWSNCFIKGENMICKICKLTDEGKQYIENNKLEYCEELPSMWDQTNLGSFMDWIPLFEDSENNMLFVNCNPENPKINQIAITSVDNHDRMGFFTLDVSLENVLQEYNEFQKEELNLSGWDEFYNVPLKRILAKRDIAVHYG